MPKESGLRQRIVGLLREHGFFVQAIESSTTPGLPDVYYRQTRTVVGWLELKQIKVWPKLQTTSLFASLNHGLSPEQINWILKETKHGGMVYILVGMGREYFLVPGSHCEIFNSFTETELRKYIIEKSDIVRCLGIWDYDSA
jgi:hypothetical protein